MCLQVNSYPTLMLFDGKTTHTLTKDRSIPGLETWFSEVLPEVFGPTDDVDAGASAAAAAQHAPTVDLSTAGDFGRGGSTPPARKAEEVSGCFCPPPPPPLSARWAH